MQRWAERVGLVCVVKKNTTFHDDAWKKKSKGKRALWLSPPSEAAHSSDIWVAHMKSTHTARQHADSAAGYCLSNTLCYSENIMIHLCTFSLQSRVHKRAVRCLRGLQAIKNIISRSCSADREGGGVHRNGIIFPDSSFDSAPPTHHKDGHPLFKVKQIPWCIFGRVSGLSCDIVTIWFTDFILFVSLYFIQIWSIFSKNNLHYHWLGSSPGMQIPLWTNKKAA